MVFMDTKAIKEYILKSNNKTYYVIMKIIKIGRSSSNDVNINDSSVSRSHCQIIQDDNGNFRLIDTNSKNGTFINGTKRHGEVRLNTSDIVRIGNTTLPWQTYFNNVGGTDYDRGRTVAGDSGAYVPSTPKPSNFLVWAILSTIFCCLPFGIVSIVYASKVDGLWYAGKYVEAQDAASKARTWFWWSFGSTLFFWIVYIILVCVGAAASVL